MAPHRGWAYGWLLLAVALEATAAVAATNLDDAKAAIRVKDFELATTLLIEEASAGNAEAHYLLGGVYASPLNSPALNDRARGEWQEAARLGHPMAKYVLAADLGRGTSEEQTRAWALLGEAARAGNARAAQAISAQRLPLVPTLEEILTEHSDKGMRLLEAAARADASAAEKLIDRQTINVRDSFGRTALGLAANAGSPKILAALLAAGASVDARDRAGMTPLMLAASSGSPAATAVLLDAGAAVNAADNAGNAALSYAARKAVSGTIGLLLRAHANVDAANSDGRTALDYAVHTRDSACIAMLRAAGAAETTAAARVDRGAVDLIRNRSILARDRDLYAGWPEIAIALARDDVATTQALIGSQTNLLALTPSGDPLPVVAVQAGARNALALILAAGSQPAVVSKQGRTALGLAITRGDSEAVQILLEHGASPDLQGTAERAPLLEAVRSRSLAIVRQLLEARASMAVTDPDGSTALILATQAGAARIAELLIRHDATVDARDREGRTALWHAAQTGQSQIATLLLDRSAAVGQGDRLDIQPLMAASAAGQTQMIQLLLGRGAELDARSALGETTLIAAARRGHVECVRALIAAGAALDAQDQYGDTALLAATRSGSIGVVKQLMEAGASAQLRNADRASAIDVAKARGHDQLARLLARE